MLPVHNLLGVERLTLFDSFQGPPQTVRRAEMWSVILALQGSAVVHLGADKLNVVRLVARMITRGARVRPFELCVDEDLLTLIEDFLVERGRETVKITKVKGHADEDMVRGGRVRILDKIGNDLADRPTDIGHRRVPFQATISCCLWELVPCCS